MKIRIAGTGQGLTVNVSRQCAADAVKTDMVGAGTLNNDGAVGHHHLSEKGSPSTHGFPNGVITIAADDKKIKVLGVEITANDTKAICIRAAEPGRVFLYSYIFKSLIGDRPEIILGDIHLDAVAAIDVILTSICTDYPRPAAGGIGKIILLKYSTRRYGELRDQ